MFSIPEPRVIDGIVEIHSKTPIRNWRQYGEVASPSVTFSEIELGMVEEHVLDIACRWWLAVHNNIRVYCWYCIM